MKKYNFIKFGENVEWMDNSTNRCLTMQVCISPPYPINSNTKITLILSDNNDFDQEVCGCYYVNACELRPALTPYHMGYWCALQTAFTNGADQAIIKTMIQNSEFTYAECTLLMQNSSSSNTLLEKIINSLFPEESEQSFFINWKKKKYPAKYITIFKGTEDEKEVQVSVTGLQSKLINSKSYIPVSKDAENLDNTIYYYLLEEEMKLTDDEIIAIVEKA